jgi:hypothetical protein
VSKVVARTKEAERLVRSASFVASFARRAAADSVEMSNGYLRSSAWEAGYFVGELSSWPGFVVSSFAEDRHAKA